MKTHQYKLTFKAIARRSFEIWFFLILFIAITVIVLTLDESIYNKLGYMIFIFLSLIPFFSSFLVHFVYTFSGINKTILIDTETIIVLTLGREIKRIKLNEIEKIIQVESTFWSIPRGWIPHYYYNIFDNKGGNLKINCYFFIDEEIWKNRFLRTNKLLSVKEVFLPI